MSPGHVSSPRISHLTDVSRIAGALHSGYTNDTHTKTKEGIPMQTLYSRCSGVLLLLILAVLLTACTSSAAPERLTTAPGPSKCRCTVTLARFPSTWAGAVLTAAAVAATLAGWAGLAGQAERQPSARYPFYKSGRIAIQY
jgi:succinate dehydrogenase hydrophobic anchor subunit